MSKWQGNQPFAAVDEGGFSLSSIVMGGRTARIRDQLTPVTGNFLSFVRLTLPFVCTLDLHTQLPSTLKHPFVNASNLAPSPPPPPPPPLPHSSDVIVPAFSGHYAYILSSYLLSSGHHTFVHQIMHGICSEGIALSPYARRVYA